ncbi:exopolysaccharide biosynthesis protein [Hyphomonas sp.]|uniref:exopolysaccharide biosynthesis protein n=1 Tax=Hyphomonas sp. TaxID=87 RepID=UPI00391B23CE
MNRRGTRTPVTSLRTLMRSLILNTEGQDVSFEELMHAVGRRAHGPVLLLIGFISISPIAAIPGATIVFATLTLIFALQVVAGLPHPWLPRRILDFRFRRDILVRGAVVAERYAHMLDALVKPRLTFLTEAPFIQLVALLCVMAALITYPLSFVPLAPFLPGLTILLFGLALTARDGVVLLLAMAAFTGGLLVVIRILPRLAALWPF